jgi:hypothetical protein
MTEAMDRLEERVNAVGDLVRHLRSEVARLERALAECPPVSPPASPVPSPPVAPVDDRLLEELSRLRDERAVVRERIRGLIREIDQVAW